MGGRPYEVGGKIREVTKSIVVSSQWLSFHERKF